MAMERDNMTMEWLHVQMEELCMQSDALPDVLTMYEYAAGALWGSAAVWAWS